MKIKKNSYPAPECREIAIDAAGALLSGSDAGYVTEEFDVSTDNPWGEN